MLPNCNDRQWSVTRDNFIKFLGILSFKQGFTWLDHILPKLASNHNDVEQPSTVLHIGYFQIGLGLIWFFRDMHPHFNL